MAAARAAHSSNRRVLPPPASASSSASCARPARARASSLRRVSSSACRPTKPGSVSVIRTSRVPTAKLGSASPRPSVDSMKERSRSAAAALW